MKTRLFISLSLVLLCSCVGQHRQVSDSQSLAVKIDSSFNSIQDSDYLDVLEPIKTQKNDIMNQVIGSAPEDLVRQSPESNMLNWGADALLDMARSTTGRQVDFAVVNKGGLRCDLPKGDVTLGSIYSLMPFDNALVILAMQGSDIIDLCNTFARRRGEGVSGLRMVINGDQADDITIGGKPLVPEAVYYVATSDYLSSGTDEMTAFTRAIEKFETGLLIRDLYIDYVRQKGVMQAKVDGRMSVRQYGSKMISEGN